jgi:hypothetical protein
MLPHQGSYFSRFTSSGYAHSELTLHELNDMYIIASDQTINSEELKKKYAITTASQQLRRSERIRKKRKVE